MLEVDSDPAPLRRKIIMATQYEIPIGAQHISLLEPLHFKFTKPKTEKNYQGRRQMGYVHRGIEQACCSQVQNSGRGSFVVGPRPGLLFYFAHHLLLTGD